jgi:hypothetical protein
MIVVLTLDRTFLQSPIIPDARQSHANFESSVSICGLRHCGFHQSSNLSAGCFRYSHRLDSSLASGRVSLSVVFIDLRPQTLRLSPKQRPFGRLLWYFASLQFIVGLCAFHLFLFCAQRWAHSQSRPRNHDDKTSTFQEGKGYRRGHQWRGDCVIGILQRRPDSPCYDFDNNRVDQSRLVPVSVLAEHPKFPRCPNNFPTRRRVHSAHLVHRTATTSKPQNLRHPIRWEST